MSQLKDIADALAAGLSAYQFQSGPQPLVTRVNWPTFDVEDMREPVLAITPAAATIERVDRVHHQYDYALNVFLGRHTPTEAGADQMLEMAEELTDVIRDHSWSTQWPAGVTSPYTVEIAMNPDEALQERNVWRAVIGVTYRVFR